MLEKIDTDIKTALLGGDKKTADALRFLKNSLNNARIALGRELNEEEAIRVIRKEIKMRIEARDLYAANERSELAAKEEFERGLYASYVPDALGQEKLLEIIESTYRGLGGEPNFASLMPAVMKAVAGQADGKTVAEAVKKYIQGE
jgi:uncharacterized protein YqeY